MIARVSNIGAESSIRPPGGALTSNASAAYVCLAMARSLHGAWMWKASLGTERQADTKRFPPRLPPLTHQFQRFLAASAPAALGIQLLFVVANSTRKASEAYAHVSGKGTRVTLNP